MWEWILLPLLILIVVLSIVTAKPAPGAGDDCDDPREEDDAGPDSRA